MSSYCAPALGLENGTMPTPATIAIVIRISCRRGVPAVHTTCCRLRLCPTPDKIVKPY